VELDITALDASADLAEDRLGGPGMWLTAIPVTGAGGMNTVWRSLRNGFDPIVWPGVAGAAHFDGGSFLPAVRAVRARASAEGIRAYTSLVPTQLARLLQFAGASDADAIEALRVLATLDAVLIGADALSDQLRSAALSYGIRCVSTYGATETTGGCIYDDQPLGSTRIEFTAEDHIVIAGPTVAVRYQDDAPGLSDRRWISNDIGRWEGNRLILLGRSDDVVKVGGAALALPALGHGLREASDARDVIVLAREDNEWGHVPVAFVVAASTADADLRRIAAAVTGRGSLPMDIVRLEALPLLPNGKPDRQSLLAMVQ